ncbi:MAG: right-handed parallel beta-helix repeat-containing protein [Ignavibacteria bacterium]|nr:right-handed parallel beta-helix repeat-containing protein [Ignavibacteria bacterium]
MKKFCLRFVFVLVLYFILNGALFSKVIRVGAQGDFPTLRLAAEIAKPGDTLLVEGTLAGGEYIRNLNGTKENWIYILSSERNPASFVGGNTAIQFSDVSYLHIKGLSFASQKLNGVNIDDGGTYETPSHHIIIEGCSWLNMDATGNNDELKLSGVDTFWVVGCTFQNGSPGGSLIDMVGCHYGVIKNSIFYNAGSNCIQAKGGSSNIKIEQNVFINGGQRAINIGGSTGLDYFRPKGAIFEASEIFVYSNIFVGSVAPIAFVGAVHCKVINNTLVNPSRWLVRILQENTNPGFLTCGNNVFANNICYFSNNASNELGINIGSNTSPHTFLFSNNLWYNTDNPNWNGPNKNLTHLNTIVNFDPRFKDIGERDFNLLFDSPAVGKGLDFDEPTIDFVGRPFKKPRAIGALEFYSDYSQVSQNNEDLSCYKIYYDKSSMTLFVTFATNVQGPITLRLFTIGGERIAEVESCIIENKLAKIALNLNYDLPIGFYLLQIKFDGKCLCPIVFVD